MDRRIGFYLPYGRQETTYLGLELASFANRSGLPVTLLSSQLHQDGVHASWDMRVRGKRTAFTDWADSCTHIVWFECQPGKLARCSHAHNTLFALWHKLQREDLSQLSGFQTVFFSSSNALKTLKEFMGLTWKYAPWSPDVVPTLRENLCTADRHVRVYIPVDKLVAMSLGPQLATVLQIIMETNIYVHFTISFHSVVPPMLKAFEALRDRFPRRIRLLRRPEYQTHLRQYLLHDWTFWPAMRAETPWISQESLTYGVPVICFDAAPMNEVIRDNYNGKLIACELSTTSLGIPTVKPAFKQILDTLQAALSSPMNVLKLQGPWPEVPFHRKEFERCWCGLWQ